MIIYKDFLCDGELCSDAITPTMIGDGAVMALESKKVRVGGEEINIGGNASKEEAEEKLEDEIKTVINIVDSHSLQKVEMDKKQYTTLQTNYWKTLLAAVTKAKNVLLFGSEAKTPASGTPDEKKAYAAAETKAATALTGLKKKEYDEVVARFASFKKNFPALQKFIKDEVLANFTEYDFYTAAEPATLGSCMIVPARYIGEATAPTFYFFMDGLLGEKA